MLSCSDRLEGAKSMGAGAATIASARAAVGIGNVFSSLIHSVARNPSLAKQLFGYTNLGFLILFSNLFYQGLPPIWYLASLSLKVLSVVALIRIEMRGFGGKGGWPPYALGGF